MRKELVDKSKFLSLILRHKPEKANIILDGEGWASVKEILTNTDITLPELLEIVDTNEKKRFTFNQDKTLIQAAQGHSIAVDVKLKKTYPPSRLYHGSKTQFLASIKKYGLTKGTRNHVHLSMDETTAKDVASRRKGQSVLFTVDTQAMAADRFDFFLSENKVYLTEAVPAKYLTYKYI